MKKLRKVSRAEMKTVKGGIAKGMVARIRIPVMFNGDGVQGCSVTEVILQLYVESRLW